MACDVLSDSSTATSVEASGRRVADVDVGAGLAEQVDQGLGAVRRRSTSGSSERPARCRPTGHERHHQQPDADERPTARSAGPSRSRSRPRRRPPTPPGAVAPAPRSTRRPAIGGAGAAGPVDHVVGQLAERAFSSAPVGRSPYQARSNSSVAPPNSAAALGQRGGHVGPVLAGGVTGQVAHHLAGHEVGHERPVAAAQGVLPLAPRLELPRPRAATRSASVAPRPAAAGPGRVGSACTVRPTRIATTTTSATAAARITHATAEPTPPMNSPEMSVASPLAQPAQSPGRRARARPAGTRCGRGSRRPSGCWSPGPGWGRAARRRRGGRGRLGRRGDRRRRRGAAAGRRPTGASTSSSDRPARRPTSDRAGAARHPAAEAPPDQRGTGERIGRLRARCRGPRCGSAGRGRAAPTSTPARWSRSSTPPRRRSPRRHPVERRRQQRRPGTSGTPPSTLVSRPDPSAASSTTRMQNQNRRAMSRHDRRARVDRPEALDHQGRRGQREQRHRDERADVEAARARAP